MRKQSYRVIQFDPAAGRVTVQHSGHNARVAHRNARELVAKNGTDAVVLVVVARWSRSFKRSAR